MQGTESEFSHGWKHLACTLKSFCSPRVLDLWREEQHQRSPKCLLHDSGCVLMILSGFLVFIPSSLSNGHLSTPSIFAWFFLHGKASSFSNVCVLLTKAVGFIFKSLPLHFFACFILLNTHDRGTYGIILAFLQIASLLLSFHYMQFKENALLCCWIVLLQYVILHYSQVLPSTML